MRQILLTRGLSAIVDNEDYDWLIRWKWHANKQRGHYYAARTQEKILMQYEILKKSGVIRKPGQIIDHINRNSLDNRKVNLRFVTPVENALNHSRIADGISFRGTRFERPWRLRVRTGPYTRKHVGVFATRSEAEEALRAYTNT